MRCIFLSRPTWLPENHEPGFAALCRVLETLALQPRTLGATDYPSKSPLDEVIRLMSECCGAMVLGYPQICLEAGSVKAARVDHLLLATEWNHIEAALAYARDLPLLVVHHTGVKRGVFDHGAINSSFDFERQNFLATAVYSEIRPYLDPSLIDTIERPRTFIVPNEARGESHLRTALLDSVGELSRWAKQ